MDNPLNLDDSNFDKEVTQSAQPVLVDFWAAWCGPCKMIAPLIDELAASYTGKVKVMKMDVDKNVATPVRYSVRGIPTLLLFKDGQVKEQIVGACAKEKIENAMKKYISTAPVPSTNPQMAESVKK